jgi:hypothetical protein
VDGGSGKKTGPPGWSLLIVLWEGGPDLSAIGVVSFSEVKIGEGIMPLSSRGRNQISLTLLYEGEVRNIKIQTGFEGRGCVKNG